MKLVLMQTLNFRKWMGRTTLFLLTVIHLILPFTPANQHEGKQIIIGAMVIGIIFLFFTIRSFRHPYRFSFYGLIFFWVVNFTAAAMEASPLSEGWVVKLIFSITLILASLKELKGSNISDQNT